MAEPEPTEDEKAAARDAAFRLLRENKEIHRAYSSIVLSRYLFYIARQELVRLLKAQTTNELTEACLVNAANKQTENPCDIHEIRDGLMKVLIPFVVETHAYYDAEEKQKQAAALAAADTTRRSAPVELGPFFKIQRGQPVLIACPPSLFMLIVEYLGEFLPANSDMVIARIASRPMPAVGNSQNYHVFHQREFTDVTDSAEAFGERLVERVKARFGRPQLDLLIVDDLFNLHRQRTSVEQPRAVMANQMQKRMRKGLKELGAGLLAAFLPDLSKEEMKQNADWAELQKHNRVIVPVVERANDVHRRITCGADIEFMVDDAAWTNSLNLGLMAAPSAIPIPSPRIP